MLGLRRLPDPGLIFALMLGLETEDEHGYEPQPPQMTRRRALSGA